MGSAEWGAYKDISLAEKNHENTAYCDGDYSSRNILGIDYRGSGAA
jgi:hypothetical protein